LTIETQWNEKMSGLVVMSFVPVDHGDLPFGPAQFLAKHIGHDGAAGPGAEN
jgi:hypothetical protein